MNMKKWKTLIALPLVAAILGFGLFASVDKYREQASTEFVKTASVGIEKKEAYKIDDAEYIGAVVTNSGYSEVVEVVGISVAILGIVLLFYRLRYKLSGLLSSRIAVVGLSAIVLGVLFGWGYVLGALPFIGLGIVEEDKKEIEALLEKAGEKNKQTIKTEIETRLAGLLTSEEFTKSLKALGLEEKTIENLAKVVETQGETLAKIVKGEEEKPMALDTFLATKHKEQISKIYKGESRVEKIFIPDSVMKTLAQRSSVTSSTQAVRLPDIGQIEYLDPVISRIFRHVSLGPDSNATVRYMDQNAVTRNADMKAEGEEAPESAIEWAERAMDVKKILDSIPVTLEAFRDVNMIAGELDQLLRVNLALKEDQQHYSGSGAGNNNKGVYTYAGALTFAAPHALAGSVENANVYDLVAAVRVAIMDGAQGKYSPSFVLMSPTDIFKYKVLKGIDGHYLLPPFVTTDGRVIDGLPVIESSQVSVNTLVVGDARYGTIYDLGGVEIEMGYVDDQFTKDTMTIKGRKRSALLIRNVNVTGFKKVADITAAINNLKAA